MKVLVFPLQFELISLWQSIWEPNHGPLKQNAAQVWAGFSLSKACFSNIAKPQRNSTGFGFVSGGRDIHKEQVKSILREWTRPDSDWSMVLSPFWGGLASTSRQCPCLVMEWVWVKDCPWRSAQPFLGVMAFSYTNRSHITPVDHRDGEQRLVQVRVKVPVTKPRELLAHCEKEEREISREGSAVWVCKYIAREKLPFQSRTGDDSFKKVQAEQLLPMPKARNVLWVPDTSSCWSAICFKTSPYRLYWLHGLYLSIST